MAGRVMMAPTLLSLLLLAPTEEPAKPNDKDKAAAAEKEKEKKDAEEKPVVTPHELRIGGKVLKYTVTTGLIPLKSEAGETEANGFFMAHVADRSGGPERRPPMFSFNRRPGPAPPSAPLRGAG